MKKLMIIIFILFTVSAGFVGAQTDFEKWKAQQNKKFNKFKEDENKRFAKFLEDEWKQFQVFRGVVFDESPKLNEAPIFNSIGDSTGSASGETEFVLSKPDLQEKSVPAVGEDEHSGEERLIFYGRELYWEKPVAPLFSARISNRAIASFWMQLADAGMDSLASWLAETAAAMQLDGWGTGVLASTLAKEIYSDQTAAQRLACWYLMVNNGYDVRVGFNNAEIYLLVPSQNMLFDTPYFTIQGSNFFIHDFTGRASLSSALYIYEDSFDPALQKLAIYSERQPQFGTASLSRQYNFTFKGKIYSGNLEFNKNLVDYYQTIPHTDSRMYFKTSLSGDLLESIRREFSPLLSKMREADKVQFLLTFVQTAFDYRTDQQQFGYEKWMLPEEALYYRYIDCEDRSILFTALVRNLLGLKVIGLDWPGHIAAAVRFTGSVAGTYVPFAGERFIICDPTYINADIGMVMPDFADKSVKIIPSE